jgi:hypothetical protein
MNAKMKTQNDWEKFLSFYAEQHKGRSTRLGVFENVGKTANDYWLEDGLPLEAISVDSIEGRMSIELLIGTLTHVVKNVRNMKMIFSADGEEDGIDLTDAEGRTTILRFETDRHAPH